MVTGGACAGCREEFRCSNWGLKHPTPRLFVTSQWPCCHPVVYIIYRVAVFGYFLAWIIISGIKSGDSAPSNEAKWFIYLTNWCFFALTSCLLVQLLVCVVGYCQYREQLRDDYWPSGMPWYFKLEWVWYNVAVGAAFTVSVAYWALLYNGGADGLEYDLNLNTHLLNSLYIIVDLFITGIPLRVYHMIHPVTFGAVYIVFSIIYDFTGGTNGSDKPFIYNVLDWSASPGEAVLYAFIVVFVGMPVLFLAAYGLYRLRLLFYNCCCSPKLEDTRSGKSSSTRFAEEKV